MDRLARFSHDQLISTICDLQGHVCRLQQALRETEALRQSADAHCTLSRLALEEEKTRLANASKKQARGSAKIKARIVAAPELQAHFEEQQRAAAAKEREAREKEQAKSVQNAERDARLVYAATSKVYDHSLSTYTKRKDDLVGLARALKINDDGANPVLLARIRDHLNAHPELASNPRFFGLFRSSRQAGHPVSAPQESSQVLPT
ncbi:hypothetical protein PUNSTDRAFT_50385 [Punctularia strigosozonata HHB-11173 SS5]|uniref:uncharacterized protein n=1 Tax=Punctularia strigosozonata (strain HHB-11173) TaxID=741275 RepID=UPI0004417DF2|nr:uncharacterized protein PUNSTDRAFT_50385 [Punctularia strigosozonata HHB-11173 SS5]EIN11354.1 hypothetical protein PUNSTDRAFT_50385 [Punctularia strigosozonata HHB-11173 SS5]